MLQLRDRWIQNLRVFAGEANPYEVCCLCFCGFMGKQEHTKFQFPSAIMDWERTRWRSESPDKDVHRGYYLSKNIFSVNY